MQLTINLTNKELDNLISSVKYSKSQVSSKFVAYPPDDESDHVTEARATLNNTHVRYTKILKILEEQKDLYIKSEQEKYS